MSDTGNETNSDAEADSPGFVDRGVNADRDLNLDPERADEPHRVSDREPPRLRDSDAGRDDPFVDEETAAAAREAGRLGGRVRADDQYDPAMAPVREAGGGEAEGFEQAEQGLIDNAQHGDDLSPDPYNDAFTPERESDRSGAAYGEADHERSTERADDRERDADAEQ